MDLENILEQIRNMCYDLPSQTEWLLITSEVSIIAGSYYGERFITDHPDVQANFIKFCASKNMCKESDTTKECYEKEKEKIKAERNLGSSYETWTPVSGNGNNLVEEHEGTLTSEAQVSVKEKCMFLFPVQPLKLEKRTRNNKKHTRSSEKGKVKFKELPTEKDIPVDNTRTKHNSEVEDDKDDDRVDEHRKEENDHEDYHVHELCQKEDDQDEIRRDDFIRMRDDKEDTLRLRERMNRKKKSLPTKKKLDEPYRYQKDGFICDICGLSVNSNRSLNLHIRKEHTGERPYVCDVCHESFFSSRSLIYHKKKTHSATENICEICGLKYPSEETLKSHLYQHRQKSQRKEVQCQHCNKILPSQKSYLKHFARNHLSSNSTNSFPMKVVKCQECGKIFTDNWRLSNHMRIHTGEKPHKCSYCGKGFADRGNMRVHERGHTETEKYECLCGKTFVQARSLKIHQRTCAIYKQGDSLKHVDISTQSLIGETINSERHHEEVSSMTVLTENCPQTVSYITQDMVIDYSTQHNNWTVGQLHYTDGQLHCTEGQLQCTKEQLHCTEGQLHCAKEQLHCAEGHLHYIEGQLYCTEGRLHCTEGQLHCTKEQLHCTEGQLHCKEGQLHCTKEQLHCTEGQLHCTEGQLNCTERQLHCRKEQLHCTEGQLHCTEEQPHCTEFENHNVQ